jgi:hypothetical protein
LVGQKPEQVFLPKSSVPEVPGTIGQELDQRLFRCKPRPTDPPQGSWTIKVLVLKEFEKEIFIRKDACIFEILGQTFHGIDIPVDERIRVVTKPGLMTNGAIFRVEKVSPKVRLALTIPTWDGKVLRCGIEISRGAKITEIVTEVQKRVEEARWYAMHVNGIVVTGPCPSREYELKTIVEIMGSIVVKGRGLDMTVQVPKLRPNCWQRLAYEALPDPPLTVNQTGPTEFTAAYQDEFRSYKVRFMKDGEGEEHVVNLLPLWENQIIRIREAFGREMVIDESFQAKGDVIYVESADGSPPDPTFERILKYTLGGDPTEYGV